MFVSREKSINNTEDNTEFAFNSFYELDFINEELPGIEYINNLDEIALFSDALKSRAAELGWSESDESLINYVIGLCKDAGVDISRQNIKNWVNGTMPSGNAAGRENVYKLCFALKMNDEETKDFFLRAYLERPFNYKNLHEAVYFFCLKSGKTYSNATRIIKELEDKPYADNSNAEDNTENIGRAIQKLKTEAELIDYITENRSGFEHRNKTATEKINKLIDECIILANEENAKAGGKKEIKSVDALLASIYSYSARETQGVNSKSKQGIRIYDSSISKSAFPKLIKRNFPQRQQIENIQKHKASYDVIRKALIILDFYSFFTDLSIKGYESGQERFFEFYDEMDAILAECGYVGLYWRNPFDWMIGYCACTPNPVDTLRDLIEEYYLSALE